jgi:hypothetical protein
MKPRVGLAAIGNAAMIRLTTAQEAPARARTITTENLVWNETLIQVSYEADWLGLCDAGFDEPYAHLELQVLAPRGAPLPVTDTGYRSEFLHGGLVEEAGGAVEFARGWLEEMSDRQSWRIARARWEQRDLFE